MHGRSLNQRLVALPEEEKLSVRKLVLRARENSGLDSDRAMGLAAEYVDGENLGA